MIKNADDPKIKQMLEDKQVVIGMTPEQKWDELRRHLREAVAWHKQQQENPKADYFYFCLRENFTRDVLGYMLYLDKPERKPGQEINLAELLTTERD